MVSYEFSVKAMVQGIEFWLVGSPKESNKITATDTNGIINLLVIIYII